MFSYIHFGECILEWRKDIRAPPDHGQCLLFGLRREFPATIFGFPDFFRKHIRKIVFLIPGNKIKFLIFSFFFMNSSSNMYHHFLAPSLLKALKSSPRYQNLPGVSPRTHSDHRGPVSAQIYLPKRRFCHLS